MINAIMYPDIKKHIAETNSVFKEYVSFLDKDSQKSEDKKGWLHSSAKRLMDVAYILNGVGFKDNWNILELGARGSAFGVFLTGKVNSVIVSDSFQIGQNKGHTWYSFDKPAPYGDLEKWGRRWIDICDNKEKLLCAEVGCRIIPFEEEKFDCVFALSVIEHIKNQDGDTAQEDLRALQEMERVVKIGGIVAITTDFSKKDVCARNRARRYTEESILNLISKTNLELTTDWYDYNADNDCSGCLILRRIR